MDKKNKIITNTDLLIDWICSIFISTFILQSYFFKDLYENIPKFFLHLPNEIILFVPLIWYLAFWEWKRNNVNKLIPITER